MGLEDARADTSRDAEFRISLIAEPGGNGPASGLIYQAAGPGGWEAQGHFVNPLTPWMVDAALSSIAAAGKTLQRSVPTDSLDPVGDLGARLYDALFSGPIERAFDKTSQAGGARVRLILGDEKTMAIPWEFLYDRRRNDFLVLSTRMPLVRSVSVSSPRPPPPYPEAPVRVLAVASDVTGAWQVGEEIEILRGVLENRPDVELTADKAVTWAGFHDAFRETEPHVVHLIATGISQTAATPLGGQALAFLTDTSRSTGPSQAYSLYGPDALAGLAVANPRLRLLVFNGCRTDGLAAGLARVVPGVIGHRGDITDAGALSFTAGLYGALGRGLSLDAAVTEARLRIDSLTPGGREWCAPVLYQQDQGIVFPAPRVRPPEMPARPQGDVAPRQGATASRDDRALQKLNSLLAIQQTNLATLLERTRRSDDATPPYIEEEIRTTRLEIERLRQEIAAAEEVPG
jgi:CHAT domain